MTTITIKQDIPGLKQTDFDSYEQLFDALCRLYLPEAEDSLSAEDIHDFLAARSEQKSDKSSFKPVVVR